MEMTTRTHLQTHFSRLLDLASQPSPTLKPTFWDKLDIDCRQASVDQDRSWKFNNGSAWDSIGPVQDEWNKFIYPRAIKPLLQDNTRMVYKNVKKQTPYSVCCWMIGKEWHSSHPAAIIICGNKRVTKNAVKLIEGHGELGRTWGFRVYGYESKISITMGTSANENDDDSPPLCAISGTRFAVGGRDFISTRMATLGGSIEIDGDFFGVTVAHPFLESPPEGLSDDDESDTSDDDSEVTDIMSHTEAPHVALEFDTAFVEEPRPHRRSILGAILNSDRPKYFSHGTDWALLKLRPADLAINLITVGSKLVVPSCITRSLSEGELWAAVNPANPVQTKASPSICGMFIPHVGLQDVWALNMKPIPGYCGSWVVDVSSSGLSGIIVAGSESNDVSYALPAHVVFDEIRGRFPTMQLQSLEHIAALPVFAFVEIIYKAKKLGLTRFVTEVVSKHSSLDNKDSISGYTPLCYAILRGYEAVAASFLEAGASPDLVGADYEMRPLALATHCGHMAIVKLVLSAGANIDSQSGHDGNTPLMYAARRGRREITHLLIARGASVNSCNALGSTALAEATEHGKQEFMTILIASGADIDKKGPGGRTPLMLAVCHENEKAAKILLEKGADVDCVDDSVRTPLLVAAEFENPAIVKLLTVNGADCNKRDLHGQTPLTKAVHLENEKTARVLLEHGADVNCVDVDGNTPLLVAVESDNPAMVKLLIERGAWVDTRNEDGDTALLLAVKVYKSPESFPGTKGRDEIVRTLLEHGANPDSQDAQDNTAISLAIAGGLDSTVRILLDYHASMDIPNSLGQTPRSLAKENENIARMLNVDQATLVDMHGKLPPVCPPAPSNSPVAGPWRGSLPSVSGPMSEPAEERRQKEKRKFGESQRDTDESMAEFGVEYRRTYRRN